MDDNLKPLTPAEFSENLPKVMDERLRKLKEKVRRSMLAGESGTEVDAFVYGAFIPSVIKELQEEGWESGFRSYGYTYYRIYWSIPKPKIAVETKTAKPWWRFW